MKYIHIDAINKQVKFLLLGLVLFGAACSFEKKTKFNKAMQNLTAHYNILYNANELLRQKQETYANTYVDGYGDLLGVYQDTIPKNAGTDKDLDLAIFKANTIIYEKEQSHYVGDAYLVIGKANFLQAKFFDAIEDFSLVIRSFPENKELSQEASVWKIRALLYLNNKREAKLAVDSAFRNINPKKSITADVYAAALQYDINTQNYADAEAAAKKAIYYCNNTANKLRWTFILGQLQELNNENDDAIISYTRMVKSNASFEMAFNANLNRIRIEDKRNGVTVDRVTLLLRLLKDENNADFKDQIYYQVAGIYQGKKDIKNAIKYYNLSVRNSVKNQNQKGLSYLRIADIDFNTRADYVSAKKYYDSTLTNLSPNYPGYQLIQKKSNNLQVLVDKLQIIAREDTLQMLAKLDEPARLKRVDALVSAQVLQQRTIAANNLAAANSIANTGSTVATPSGRQATGSSFYFYNTTAVSQGYNDFKRIWGTRVLEDDWRRSSKQGVATASGSSNSTQGTGSTVINPATPIGTVASQPRVNTAGNAYRQELLQNLPLTPALLVQSNARIYSAYTDIANFYRDILEDKKEAIAYFELLLNNYPDDPNKPLVLYNLYRLYSDIDIARSTDYKNRLLKVYPESIFAKVIIDPDYSKKLDDNDSRFNQSYNLVYDLYRQKKYTQVVKATDSLLKQYPGNKLLTQLYYLRAIAGGHSQNLGFFRADLELIVANYPNDRLITPLIRQHLNYINENTLDLAAQKYAIMDSDTSGAYFIPPVTDQKDAVYNRNRQFNQVAEKRVIKPEEKPVVKEQQPAKTIEKLVVKTQPPVTKPAEKVVVKDTPIITKPAEQLIAKEAPVVNKQAEPSVVAPPPPKAISKLFNQRDSTNYYFVINVSTGTTDLSSSRFGIGQFDRANYPPSAIKHQLKDVGRDNQLIYIGRFYNLNAVKDYARAIIPLLPEIMKVPKDKYSFFIITQQNLDKLANKKLLDDYIDYYQQIY